jgi:hypothetical protein
LRLPHRRHFRASAMRMAMMDIVRPPLTDDEVAAIARGETV